MSRFFVRRPIVAIVIAIVTVLVGLVAMRALPISRTISFASSSISIYWYATPVNANCQFPMID